MTEIESRICANFRQAKNPREQIEIDAQVYLLSINQVIDIIVKYGYDAEQYRGKKTHKQREYVPIPRKYSEDRIKELYDDGKTDLEIAKITGANRQVAYYWRLKNGLPSNGRKKRSPNKKAAQLEL